MMKMSMTMIMVANVKTHQLPHHVVMMLMRAELVQSTMMIMINLMNHRDVIGQDTKTDRVDRSTVKYMMTIVPAKEDTTMDS